MFKMVFLKSLFACLMIVGIGQPEVAFAIPIEPTVTQEEPSTQVASPESTAAEKTDTSSWLSWISNTMTQTNSLAVRLLLVFFLGLLMSLTPCIYPMMPITAGILQTQSSKSILTSFLLSLSYTFGIATTFAILGLLAAFAGQAMGQFMSHPAFIIPLVALLFYLALSMIGLYDMYIPRFLQPRNQKVNGGSFISAFMFGAISGIVASPCLSPGLVCLLCLVTTLNSTILGFILLFVFGVGISMPLLIIGTFSSSLSLLPRAGMWMVEIKKIFGFLMLGMCLYFLSYIVPASLINWILVVSAGAVGSMFLLFGAHAYNRTWKIVYTLLGIALLVSAGYIGFKCYSVPENNAANAQENKWQTDYVLAQQEAITHNKLLFVDIGAPFCSICKAIDKTLFANQSVRSSIETIAVPVKIDGSSAENAELIKQYHVLGFPTILLVNPGTQEVIKQWGPELYGKNSQEFIDEIKRVVHNTQS